MISTYLSGMRMQRRNKWASSDRWRDTSTGQRLKYRKVLWLVAEDRDGTWRVSWVREESTWENLDCRFTTEVAAKLAVFDLIWPTLR